MHLLHQWPRWNLWDRMLQLHRSRRYFPLDLMHLLHQWPRWNLWDHSLQYHLDYPLPQSIRWDQRILVYQ